MMHTTSYPVQYQIVFMTVLVLGSASVQAQVYKCQRGQEVVYSDRHVHLVAGRP